MAESEEELKSLLTDVQNSLLDSVGEGEGGMFQENSIETYIIQGETDHQPRLDA